MSVKAVRNDIQANTLSIKRRKKGNATRLGTTPLHLMMLPGMILLFIYAYVPMLGIIIAFQKFDPMIGLKAFWTSPWVGFGNFRQLWEMPGCLQALINTVNIAWWKMVLMFVIPVVISLLLNEIRRTYVKRTIQTLVYLPHFMSWVIMAGIIRSLLSMDGMINSFLKENFGMEPILFLGDKVLFPHIIIWSDVWKEFGFSTIIFLSAIAGIDPSLYEAAIMDGATKLRQTWHITLPGMKPIMILCAVLSLGSILNAGFDQIFNLYSVPVYETGDIIDTLVYRVSMQQGQYDIGTALGLFKSVVSLILVSFSYWLAYKVAKYEIF